MFFNITKDFTQNPYLKIISRCLLYGYNKHNALTLPKASKVYYVLLYIRLRHIYYVPNQILCGSPLDMRKYMKCPQPKFRSFKYPGPPRHNTFTHMSFSIWYYSGLFFLLFFFLLYWSQMGCPMVLKFCMGF